MVVYIEYVLINNFLVTLMLLVATNLCLKEKNTKLRYIFACLFGVLIAILYPLCNISGMLLLLLKGLAGFIICAIAYKSTNIKKLVLYYVVFMFLTAMYGGLNMMIYFAIYGNFQFTQTLPLPIILFSIFAITYLIKQISLVIYRKKQISSFLYETEITSGKCKVTANAYLDSGNVLCDPETNTPIVVINYKIFKLLFKNFSPIKLVNKDIKDLQNGHYIKVSTVTSNGEMLVFNVDNIILKLPNGNKTIPSPMLGLTITSFKHLGCDLLLNPKLIG